MSIVTLATDLDGTLIPLDNNGNSKKSLCEIDRRHKANEQLQLIFITGRHLSSVLALYEKINLPVPDIIVCDVGTSIYRYVYNSWLPVKKYSQHLSSLIQNKNRSKVEESLSSITGLTLQEKEKQAEFKISYYVNSEMLPSVLSKIKDVILIANLPFNVVHSIDPFTGGGLIDILPKGVTKKYALEWMIEESVIDSAALFYAGDSGNDREVFLSGIKSIIVNNASAELKNEIKEKSSDLSKLFFSSHKSVEGVLEGCDYFGWK